MNHKVSGRTFFKVTVVHVIVIACTLLPIATIFHFQKKDDTKFIEMVSLGTQNPAKGAPGPSPAVAKATTPKPAEAEAPPAPPPPAPPAKVETPPPPKFAKVEEPPPPAPNKEDEFPELKHIVKSEAEPWDNPEAKAKEKDKKVSVSTKVVTRHASKSDKKSESQVEVNTKVVTRKVPWSEGGDVGKKSDKKKSGKIYGKAYEGPSEGEIQSDLKKGLQTVGVFNGNEDGSGMLGRPDGQGTWYHTLIRETFLRNWKKPQLPGAAKLETLVSIRIAPDGGVTFLGISKSSGNDAMDESVRKAAGMVTKLSQPLPSGLGHPDYEVTINFRLD